MQASAAVQHQPGVRHVHESIYCEGSASELGGRGRFRGEHPELNWAPGRFRLHRRDDLPLDVRAVPRNSFSPGREAAHLLAQKADWGPSLRSGRNWPQPGCRWPAPSMPRTCTWSLTAAATPCGAWQQPRLDHQRARAQRPAGRWREQITGPAHPAWTGIADPRGLMPRHNKEYRGGGPCQPPAHQKQHKIAKDTHWITPEISAGWLGRLFYRWTGPLCCAGVSQPRSVSTISTLLPEGQARQTRRRLPPRAHRPPAGTPWPITAFIWRHYRGRIGLLACCNCSACWRPWPAPGCSTTA